MSTFKSRAATDTAAVRSPESAAAPGPVAPAAARPLFGTSSEHPPTRSRGVDLVGQGKLVSLECNPVPPGSESGYFDGLDLARIRYARWEAEPEAVRTTGGPGTIVMFTGRAEYIEKYFETIGDLRRRGFDVAIMDWRGQGRSARLLGNPDKGHVTTFAQYHADLANFMRDVVLPDCRPPYFALAHSMGGTVLLQAAARRQPWFRRMVLTAPMLRLFRTRPGTRTIRRISEIVCYAGLDALSVPAGDSMTLASLPFHGNVLTSDPVRFARTVSILKAAPELSIGAPTFGWLHAAGRAMETVTRPDFASSIRTPVLMVASGRDRLVSTAAIEQLEPRLRGGGAVTIDGARHEVMMERDSLRELFWAAFDAFIPGTEA